MITRCLRFILFTLLVYGSLHLSLSAQDGQNLDFLLNPFPETGAWDAKDGSRTGFFMEVQNGIMAGAYFGANAAGDNVWLIFSGQLQPLNTDTDNVQDGWVLESPLRRTSAAGCILDCAEADLLDPVTDEVAQIRLEFSGRSRATFSVDDAEPTEIYPAYWGNPAFAFDPEQPNLFLPNLTGTWVGISTAQNRFDASGSQAFVWEIGAREIVPIDSAAEPGMTFLEVRYPLASPDLAPPPAEHAIVCKYIRQAEQLGIDSPVCLQTISTPTLLPDPIAFFNLITDSRITLLGNSVGDVPGFTVRTDFFRLNYD